MTATPSTPVFLAFDLAGDPSEPWPDAIAWAGEAVAGALTVGAPNGDGAQNAAEAITALAKGGTLFARDPLFEACAMARVFAAAHAGPAPIISDWMLALAPFRQARNLAAIVAVARDRVRVGPQPAVAAAMMLEAWREAKRRAEAC